jgi:hypothetical protein
MLGRDDDLARPDGDPDLGFELVHDRSGRGSVGPRDPPL